MGTNNDNSLWHIAKKRAAFKRALIAYLVVNLFLWLIYLVNIKYNTHPWPLWAMLGWGVGLTFFYVDAYHSNHLFSAEKEYEKLKNNINN